MMQYLLTVHGSESDMAAVPAETMQVMYAQVDKFNTEVQEAGAWVFAGGLQPASTATVVRTTDGKVATTDGPYLETKEHIGASGSSRRTTWTRPWPGPRKRRRLPGPGGGASLPGRRGMSDRADG